MEISPFYLSEHLLHIIFFRFIQPWTSEKNAKKKVFLVAIKGEKFNERKILNDPFFSIKVIWFEFTSAKWTISRKWLRQKGRKKVKARELETLKDCQRYTPQKRNQLRVKCLTQPIDFYRKNPHLIRFTVLLNGQKMLSVLENLIFNSYMWNEHW